MWVLILRIQDIMAAPPLGFCFVEFLTTVANWRWLPTGWNLQLIRKVKKAFVSHMPSLRIRLWATQQWWPCQGHARSYPQCVWWCRGCWHGFGAQSKVSLSHVSCHGPIGTKLVVQPLALAALKAKADNKGTPGCPTVQDTVASHQGQPPAPGFTCLLPTSTRTHANPSQAPSGPAPSHSLTPQPHTSLAIQKLSS